MMVNGLKSDLKSFGRKLSKKCIAGLKQLAESPSENWWKDVLESKSLLLAVRDGYLNAYVNGQSVFKISVREGGAEAGQPRLAIHYKYLIKPELEEKDPYISFDGKAFALDPATIVNTAYQSKLTLPQLVKTASRFSHPEKTGVHKIAQREPKVVDLEIAFTRSGDDGELSAPRMDLAVLIPNRTGGADLVFCEAKCASNPELSRLENEKPPGQGKVISAPSPRRIAVVAQMEKYEKFIRDETTRLVNAYVDVCRALMAIDEQRPISGLDDLVREVGEGRKKLSIHPNVYLLVYDFDEDQRDGALKKRLSTLRAQGLRIIAKGNAKDFRLANDIARAEAGAGSKARRASQD